MCVGADFKRSIRMKYRIQTKWMHRFYRNIHTKMEMEKQYLCFSSKDIMAICGKIVWPLYQITLHNMTHFEEITISFEHQNCIHCISSKEHEMPKHA